MDDGVIALGNLQDLRGPAVRISGSDSKGAGSITAPLDYPPDMDGKPLQIVWDDIFCSRAYIIYPQGPIGLFTQNNS